MLRIAVAGDYNPGFESHPATTAAILLAASSIGAAVDVEWVPTNEIDDTRLAPYDGIWGSPGSPYRSFDGMLHAIRYARQRGRPFVAT